MNAMVRLEDTKHKRSDKMNSSRYDNIINLPHHTSKRHPPMSRESRAAQFSPFAALTGYDALIAETDRQTDERQALDEDQMAVLNNKIQILIDNITKRPEVTIHYFVPDKLNSGGSVQIMKGNVRVVEPVERVIILTDDKRVPLDYITDISSPLFVDMEY